MNPIDDKTLKRYFTFLREGEGVQLIPCNLRAPEQLREHMIQSHMALVHHCAGAFIASGEPIEDLVQEGSVGLIKALARFDPKRKVKFSTYATHLINGEIRHYLRDRGRIIHRPGWFVETAQRVHRTTEDLTDALGYPPSPSEVAAALGIQVNAVRQVYDADTQLTPISLDDIRFFNGERDEQGWEDVMGNEPFAFTDHSESKMLLHTFLPRLNEKEREALCLFYFHQLSKTEIAAQMGLSVNYACYLIRRSLDKLRIMISENVEPPKKRRRRPSDQTAIVAT